MKIKKYLPPMGKVLLTFILVSLTLAGFSGCNKTGIEIANTDANTDETQIILFHVNDMHAQIDNFAKIAWAVQQEKKNNPKAHILLFNAGDNFSGNPIVDQAEPKGEPVLQLLNHMNFNVMTLGNHEFDYGQEALKHFINEANFPIICANAELKGEDQSFPQLPPFIILETGNQIKIAVLGLIQVDEYTNIPSTHPRGLKGFTFADPIETAKKYRHLKKENDIFIALTHLGIETDELLAKEMGELDVIVGGHSHSYIFHSPTRTEINNVLIAQAGGNARYLGRIELILKNKQLVKKNGKLIEVASIKEEIPELKEMITKFNNNPTLNQVIATLPRPLNGIIEIGNLTSDALRKSLNLDIVFNNSGGIRVKNLGPDVKLKDIYALHPFENQMVQFEMTPAEIRSLIWINYQRHKRMDLFPSGIQYVVKHTPEGKVKTVELIDPQGKLLDETKTYKVGMNDYIVGTYEFNHQDPGKSLMTTLNEALIEYLKQEKDVCTGIKALRMLEVVVDDNGKSK